MPERVLAAVSGGVDSAVAAYLLKQSGFEVIGATMQLMPREACEQTAHSSCCLPQGIESARRICDRLGITHSVVDMTGAFEHSVVRYFLDEYSRGRTPNPCVLCNRIIKFASLCFHAAGLGCARIATGHYARVETNAAGRRLLKRGADPQKDQSYFLWALVQEQLGIAAFPVGAKTKDEVRAMAAEIGILDLVTPESQEICFTSGNSYHPFLRKRKGGQLVAGPIRDSAGSRLGEHEGIELYTIGQRRGLGVAGGRPLYVVDIVPSENAVVLGAREEAMSGRFTVLNPNWIAWGELPSEFDALVKIRYLHPGARAHIAVKDDWAKVELEEPQFAVAPGQSAVFYDGDTVLGGAVIESRS
jgi:tRNA-specific 2-thiouridylase